MGQEGIFAMLEELYARLERSEVRHLFPEDMAQASLKSAAFFVQILGGPPLFSQTYGPPRMRARHLPFEIDGQSREIWLACFLEVLETEDARYSFPAEHIEGFKAFLGSFSSWMINVAPK